MMIVKSFLLAKVQRWLHHGTQMCASASLPWFEVGWCLRRYPKRHFLCSLQQSSAFAIRSSWPPSARGTTGWREFSTCTALVVSLFVSFRVAFIDACQQRYQQLTTSHIVAYPVSICFNDVFFLFVSSRCYDLMCSSKAW